MGEHGAPDPGIAQCRVGHLVGHADGEGDIGEVAVAGPLLPVLVPELDAPGLGPEVLVSVAQGVDRVHHGPGQHDGQHGSADQQHPRRAVFPSRQVKRVTHPQEAGDAGPDQQRPRGALRFVFAGSKLRRARTVGPDNDRPGGQDEGERSGVPPSDQCQPPPRERQEG